LLYEILPYLFKAPYRRQETILCDQSYVQIGIYWAAHWLHAFIITTTTGKTALFEPQPSLEDSARSVFNQTIRFSLLWISYQSSFTQQGRQLLNDLKETRYWKLEEAPDRTLWRTQFGRGYGPVARQILDLKVVSLMSNPKSGGPGLCIYAPE
jgi:hypothetical protein